jgi:hypothetical protein
VQRIIKCRHWPTTVLEYARMMEDEDITFTGKGDAAVVKHIFFKVGYTLDGAHWGSEAAARRRSTKMNKEMSLPSRLRSESKDLDKVGPVVV